MENINLKLYFLSRRLLDRLFSFLSACLNGIWLGILPQETLHQIDQNYYEASQMYCDQAYNRRGLWVWETQVVEKYLPAGAAVLVLAAGGGREVLALRQLGFAVDGFECNVQLVEFANQLMQQEHLPPIQYLERDRAPTPGKTYDGVIIGWGAYMLIQGQQRRIEFLQQLRQQMSDRAPLLISFFCQSSPRRYFQVVATVGNGLRRLLNRERLDLGDDLAPEFVHYFTKDQILAELDAGGFELALYATEPYGHAVGIARQLIQLIDRNWQ